MADDHDDRDEGEDVVLPPPLIYDAGPYRTTATDERAIQNREDRITKLDQRDRGN